MILKFKKIKMRMVFYYIALIILLFFATAFRDLVTIPWGHDYLYVAPLIIYFLISYPIFFLILRRKFKQKHDEIDARVYSLSVSFLAILIPLFLYICLVTFYAYTGYLKQADIESSTFFSILLGIDSLKYLGLLDFLFNDFGSYFLSLSLTITIGFIISGLIIMSYGKFTKLEICFTLLKFGLITTVIHSVVIIITNFGFMLLGR